MDARMNPVASEAALLGALVAGTVPDDAIRRTFSLLSPGDLFEPKHSAVLEACMAVFAQDQAIDPTRVLPMLLSRGLARAIPGSPAVFLHELVAGACNPGSVTWHADEVFQAAQRRHASVTLSRALQQLEAVEDLGGWWRDLEEAAVVGRALAGVGVRDSGFTDLTEFLAEQDVPAEFVIPEMLARGEKAVITGGEGLGKSTVFRQLSLCAAVGLHPFTRQPVMPRRVMFVDAENSPSKTRRELRGLVALAEAHDAPIRAGMFRVPDRKVRALNLLKAEGVAWLLREATEFQPHLVFIGPLYKLTGGRSLIDEEVAQRVIDALERLSDVSDAALLIEAHAGKGKDRGGDREWSPRGSSALLGWPDFGFGIAPGDESDLRSAVVHPWRGGRELGRRWPRELIEGARWPWEDGSRPVSDLWTTGYPVKDGAA